MSEITPGELLKEIRENVYGFTQEDLSIVLGVDKNTIARWERNEAKISKQIKNHILTILERDCDSSRDATGENFALHMYAAEWESLV